MITVEEYFVIGIIIGLIEFCLCFRDDKTYLLASGIGFGLLWPIWIIIKLYQILEIMGQIIMVFKKWVKG